MHPFWSYHGDFWIGTALGIIGLGLTIWAVFAATGAKEAAINAGRTVKMQTVALELMGLAHELDSLDPEILFPAARDFLNRVNFKLRRLIAPFQDEAELALFVASIRDSLTAAKTALSGVRPAAGAAPAPVGTVYNAIEADLATISGSVADLLGLMQTISMNIIPPEDDTQ
jgi:hypothetical protein